MYAIEYLYSDGKGSCPMPLINWKPGSKPYMATIRNCKHLHFIISHEAFTN